jgi:hypothetical protein
MIVCEDNGLILQPVDENLPELDKCDRASSNPAIREFSSLLPKSAKYIQGRTVVCHSHSGITKTVTSPCFIDNAQSLLLTYNNGELKNRQLGGME